MSLRLPPSDYANLTLQVLKRDGFRCRHCNLRNNLHCHHVIYRSQGGEDVSWNLCTLCSSCHDGVHAGKLVIDVAEGNYVGSGGGCDSDLLFTRAEEWRPK